MALGMDEHEYYAYRYFLVEAKQLLLFPPDDTGVTDERKRKMMQGLLDTIRQQRRSAAVRSRRMLIYFVSIPCDSVYVCQMAPEKHFKKHQEGEQDLETVEDTDYPPLVIVFDLRNQIILIQKRSAVYKDPDAARGALERLLRQIAGLTEYDLHVQPISPSRRFWEVVDDSDKIYQLDLTLESPNLFGGRLKANELVRDFQTELSSTENRLSFKNPKGALRVARETWENVIDYISSGGGRYSLLASIRGRRRRHSSSDETVSVKLTGGPHDLKTDELQVELAKLNRFNEGGPSIT